MPFKDLRQFISFLEREKELIRIKKEIDVRFEIGAVLRKLSDEAGPAVLFEKVKDFEIPVIGNVCATHKRIAMALETTEKEGYKEYVKRIEEPIPPKIIKDGPVKEVIKIGDKVDVSKFPAIIHNELDGGRFISLGVLVAKHPETGIRNAGIYRHQVKGKRKLGIQVQPPQHLALYNLKAEELGKSLEIAIAIGLDPVICIAASSPAPWQCDEFVRAGSLRGEPLELVKCETVDLEVPANAEMVIEGEILPNVREPEGPYGEVTGYYSLKEDRQVINVTAITHRKDMIYQTSYVGYPVTEDHTFCTIGATAESYKALRMIVPTIKDIHLSDGGIGKLNAIISIDKKSWGHEAAGKRTIMAAFGTLYVMKNVVVVDDDIDVRNPAEVEWAITTRVRPDEDIIIIPSDTSMTLDPSARALPGGGRTTAKMGIDATMPLEPPYPQVVRPPLEVMKRIEATWKEYVGQ